MSEAYDSDAESSSSSVSPETIRKEAVVRSGDYDDDGEEEEEALDWDSVVAKLRTSVLDRSKKRRSLFINRYLVVRENSPPFSHVPAIFTTLLSVLSSTTLPDHVDQIVNVLMDLVRRDEGLAEGVKEKFKLGDKLVKWVSVEVEKAATGTKVTTAANFVPYHYTILGLTSTLAKTRKPLDTFGASAQFSELINSLAIVVDVMEARSANGKETTRDARFRRKTGIRTWRLFRELRDLIPRTLDLLLAKTTNPSRYAVLLGHVIGVALRLKETKTKQVNNGRSVVEEKKDAIATYYSSHILASKIAVPRYASTALDEFLAQFVDFKMLTEKLLPAAEKMLLRSPEVALELTADLLNATSHDISSLLPAKLLPAILSASKSSNADTRAKSVDLFRAVIQRTSDVAVQAKVVTEVLALPKTGKSASAEHRVVLFTMSRYVPPSDENSASVIDILVPIIGKENNDAALAALAENFGQHLTHVLASQSALAPTTSTTLAKELHSAKLTTRRALSGGIASAIWQVGKSEAKFSAEGEELVSALAPAFEANLKTAVANPASTPGGFLEGYAAVALALGPLSGVQGAAKLANSPLLAELLVASPKPSFLLNDKAYGKLPTATDREWFSLALISLVTSQDSKLDNEAVRVALGLAFIHLAFDTKHAGVFGIISRIMSTHPTIFGRVIREALSTWLRNEDIKRAKASKIADEDDGITSKSQKIGRLLSAVFKPHEGLDKAAFAQIAVDYLVLTHHPEIGEDAQVSWIALVQSIGLDPATLAFDHQEQILDVLWTAASAPPEDARFAEAAYRAATTLTFIHPAVYVDVLLDQVRADLDPTSLDFIGLEERGIWATPPDQPFVDVLSTKKDAVENKNRKDYATEKWEQEVRESLQKKKPATLANLSKADRAAVNAQLAKEAAVRKQIAVVQARLARGVELVRSLVASNAEAMEKHVGELARLLLNSVFASGSFLVDNTAFAVFLSLAGLATDRLGEYRRLLAAAVLRSYDAPFVADDYLHENLGELVTRLLHQINFVADQTPLNSTSFSVVALLLDRVVETSGIGADSAQSEQAQEQLTLVVNIIAACGGEFQDDAYPRLQTIRDLLLIITNHSKLAKDAAAALTDLGAAIKDVASEVEIKEMIAGTLSKDSNVRNAALQALQPVDLTDLDYSEELWIAVHDADEQNANLATHIWEDNGLDIPETYLASLLRYLAHDSAAVRLSCAAALADAAEHFPAQVGPTVQGLEDLYIEMAKPLEPEYDRFGMVIPESVNRADPFEARVAVAMALNKLTPSITQDLIVPIFEFLIVKGALGDRHSAVRKGLLDAAIALIDLHGAEAVADLMKMFEEYLGKAGKSTSETDDYIKEAVVILFGRLARHLDADDDRIPKVVDRLVDALNTPSELVQSAVADCLPPLVQSMSDEVEYLVDKLFSTLTTGAKYASRRGAAYGLAGVIKGRGLVALKEYELIEKLKEAAEDKSSFQSRQGAAFAFETLSATLGKVFEPYIIDTVPLLLTLFGDSNADVREATQDAARVIMSRISGHCVKLMLPTLLGGLEEKQWRTKKGSIELLGSMAFCAPRQLSLSLPTIIPQLTGVINDSHAQVKSAANTSLKRFGEVLNNPEIKAIQNTLMKALADPAAKTGNALTALLKTSFEHYLDAPSLALVMPIIDRGLRNRSSDTKKRSVQIVGNMASLTESRDLVPYLNELMPLVREVLVDPVPEARATAAKSLGTLVERLGENNFPDLVPQLLGTLKSDTSGVDRQGAAQGLSEVLSGLGMERLEGLLPEIINNTSSPRAYVREGFISLLVYLPATFGHRFAPHLGRVVPPILNGLADDSEYVREASMRAGKMIIANYSSKAIDLLLPELLKGMLDSSWRIRQSSISLTGELLYRVTGISGKVELEEEAPAHTADTARKALLEALGPERKDRVLATLYIVRQDAVGVVRQASIHIWKALVHNTPRATREILPVLMQLIMSLLGSPEVDQQETASRTLGELCRKNGERIFGEILPILQKAISSPDARTKEGACLAFADVMAASNKDVIADHEETIISAVRTALVDPSDVVRQAAAKTFDTMQHYMGAKAIDQTIPTLLEAMRNPGEGSETALQALQEVMSVRAHSVFPVLIPTLIAQPISAFNARALGALVRVAGAALNKRLDTVLGALVQSLEKEKDEDVLEEINGAIESLLESVVDSDGIHLLEMLLFGWAKDNNPTRRETACNVFATMCQVNEADTSDYRVDWIRILVSLFDDPVEEVVTAAWSALEHFVKTVDKDELEDLVVPLRRTIESTGSPGKDVPGFSRPKGVQSIVPILLAGVLNGTQEQREQAAYGIGDLVLRTSEAAIKPYIIQLTGPLIRVISGQSIAPQIKSAILATLTVLLEQVPTLVRPFHPQLTRTFVKSAADPVAISVRNRAATGLGELMKHQPRVDPLITELVGLVRSSEKDIQPSIAIALGAVCASAGKNIGPAAKASIVELVEEAFAEGRNETYNNAIGKVVAGLAQTDPESIRPIVETFLAAPTPPTMIVSIVIRSIMEEAPSTFHTLDQVEDVVKKVQASVSLDTSAIARPAREAREIMRSDRTWKADEAAQALVK